MRNVLAFLKREVVFTISLLLAILSCILAPGGNMLASIDWRTIGLLFSLMLVVQAFSSCGVFAWASRKLEEKVHGTRSLAAFLVLLVFMASMLVTNDVSLIAFVPFTLLVYPKEDVQGQRRLVVLETIAANLGSMTLPFGNPQNLYLYSHYQLDTKAFLLSLLPLTAVSLVLLLFACLTIRNQPVGGKTKTEVSNGNRRQLTLAIFQFLLVIATVLRAFDWRATLIVMLVSTLFSDKKLFGKVDYPLLGTFCFFFIFTGNMARIPAVTSFLTGHISGHEFGYALFSSQVISNVPAAILLSRFTSEGMTLVLGTDVGGLGTLVASLASLIGFKCYTKTGRSKGAYLISFTFWNLLFLLVLVPAALLLL